METGRLRPKDFALTGISARFVPHIASEAAGCKKGWLPAQIQQNYRKIAIDLYEFHPDVKRK
jgi:hypothetical protein